MKSAEEIRNIIAQHHSVRGNSCKDWEDAFYEVDTYEQFNDLVDKAMKAYASQAIDRCAEVAKTRFMMEGNTENVVRVVSKNSILKIKNELK